MDPRESLDLIGRTQREALAQADRDTDAQGRGSTWTVAAALWIFIALLGTESLPDWSTWPLLAVYLGGLALLARRSSRRNRIRPHRTQYRAGRLLGFWTAGAVALGLVVGGSLAFAEHVDLPYANLIAATACALFFGLVVGPVIGKALRTKAAEANAPAAASYYTSDGTTPATDDPTTPRGAA